jgi:hypothetical protein
MLRKLLPFVLMLAGPTACAVDTGTTGQSSQYQTFFCDDAGVIPCEDQEQTEDSSERGLSAIGSLSGGGGSGATPTPAPRGLGDIGLSAGNAGAQRPDQGEPTPPAPRNLGDVGQLAGETTEAQGEGQPGEAPAKSRTLAGLGGLSSFAPPSPVPSARSLGDLGTFGSTAGGFGGGGGSIACDLRGQGLCMSAPGGSEQDCAEQGGTITSVCPPGYFGTCTQEIAGFRFVSYVYPEGGLAEFAAQQAFAASCESGLNGVWAEY